VLWLSGSHFPTFQSKNECYNWIHWIIIWHVQRLLLTDLVTNYRTVKWANFTNFTPWWLSLHGVWAILYGALQIWLPTCKFLESFLLFSLSFSYFEGIFNKTIISLTLVGYEMTKANLVLRASLTIYHPIPMCAPGIIVKVITTIKIFLQGSICTVLQRNPSAFPGT